MDTYRPDVVHAMHIVGWPALVAASERGIRSVVSAHALELGRTSLARRALAEATVVHSVSEFTKGLTLEVVGDSVDGRVIPPSIDTSGYTSCRKPDANDAGTATIVTVARLVERKNIGTLIDAVKRLDERLERDILLRVVGEGDKRDELEKLASSAPVVFEGWVSEDEKRALLSESDVFALVPRRIGFDVEGFGIVYIEAQAAGTPVIGSRRGGVPEAIGDGGLIVDDERSTREVATALERLLIDEQLREDCLDAAAERIDGFDRRAIAARHLDMYESATASRTATGRRDRLSSVRP
jgi:phosphatidylinositol alpha-1,6-mannosyltransferase